MAKLYIRPLNVKDDDDIAQLVALRSAQQHVDSPQWPVWDAEVTRASVRTSNPIIGVENWVGVLDGTLIAFVDMLFPRNENLQNVHFEGIVHPSCRGRGIGATMYDHVCSRAQRHNRGKLSTTALASLDSQGEVLDGPGIRFCQQRGLSQVLSNIRRQIDMDTVSPQHLAQLRSNCEESGSAYRLVTWMDTADEQYAADLAYLQGRMATDSPRENLDWEATPQDVRRWRGVETMALRRKRTTYYAAAVHRESDRLVAWTSIMFNKHQREHAMQQTTIVDPQHRGHRLGMAIKVTNIEAVRRNEPALRYIHSENAASNRHMVAINDALGFEPFGAAVTFQGKWGL